MEKLAYYWPRFTYHGFPKFDELNMTGHDFSTVRIKTGRFFNTESGEIIPEIKEDYILKRYLIKDDRGRIIDPRTWPTKVWNWEPEFKGKPDLFNKGSKRNFRKCSAPSFSHYNAREFSAALS